MYKRLPVTKKRELIACYEKGESVTKLCRESGISRTIFYTWVKTYKNAARRTKPLVLVAKNPKGKKHHSYTIYSKEKEILKAVLKKPSITPKQIAQRCDMSVHGVWNVLKRHKLNTIALRENYVQRNGSSWVRERSIDEKMALMRRVEAGESVTKLCREYNVSRTVLYRWYKRYQQAQQRESLYSRRPKGEKHYRYVEAAPSAILEIVVADPELSPVQIARRLREKIGRQILGAHGVYNFLKKHRLNKVEFRVRYAAQAEQAHTKQAVEREITLPSFGFDRFISFVPPPLRSRASILRNILPISLFTVGILSILAFWIFLILDAQDIANKFGIFFSFAALLFGMFFFLYSLKSYFMISIVLSFSRHEDEDIKDQKPFLDMVLGMFGIKLIREKTTKNIPDAIGSGLTPDLSNIHLKRHPFVSIHLAMYNEKRVVDRLLTAATSMQYDNYEVIVADDSTDPEALTLLSKWKHHPRVKILHRENRDGYKGQALQNALRHTDRRAEFIMIFDADFIPYPDSATSFLKYFQAVIGSLDHQAIKKSPIAAVQGYQWHVLNKSENWITRGVRSEYAGSYVVERSAGEVYQGLKQISGSVYMIRRDVVEQIGWGRSITEDFEFTLKLYNQGFKVVYTPYIQAPSEAVSTVKRIIRQRMRWAEGHSFNVKKMFWSLLRNPKLTFVEKAELVYLTPYYLQSAFFIAGTLSWFIAELVFQTRLPFWTALWGWSLIFTNMFALPLMNMVGLFLEESSEKDYLGLLSFVGLSYIVAPFQGYAAIKGFVEKEEGPWFRTPKTGRITDSFTPGHFYRYVKGFFGIKQSLSNNMQSVSTGLGIHPYIALATANNTFNKFAIKPVKKRWVGKSILAVMLICAIMLNYLSFFTPKTYAAAPDPTIEQQINIIDRTFTTTSGSQQPTDNSNGLILWDSSEYSNATVYFEANVKFTTGGTATSATASLYSESGTQVTGSAVTNSSTGTTTRIRSGALTLGSLPNLQTDTKYTVRVGCNTTDASATCGVTAARLIIVQTSPTGIQKTDTQIEVGNNETGSQFQTTFSSTTGTKFYTYTQSLFTPTPVATFEATLSTTNGTVTGNSAQNTCGTGADLGAGNPTGSTQTWTNATTFCGAAVATSVMGGTAATITSTYLKATNFGFTTANIPSTATILGITVVANELRTGAGGTKGDIIDNSVRLVNSSGTIVGTDHARASTSLWGTTSGTAADVTYGASSDNWSAGLTAADVVSSGFGVVISAKGSTTATTRTANIDYVKVTISYSAPVSGAALAELYDVTAAAPVSGSEVVALTTNTYISTRSAGMTLVDGHQYRVLYKNDRNNVVPYIASAKILLHQEAAGGITALETMQQEINTKVNNGTTTPTSFSFANSFDKANFAGGTFAALFETDIATANVGSAYFGQLDYNGGTGTLTGTDSVPTQRTSANIWSSLPATATNIDTQIYNASTVQTTSTNSWLKIQVSGLSVPENVLLLIPIIFFLPKIIQIIQEVWRRRRKGEQWSSIWQYIRSEFELEKDRLFQKLYTTLGPPLARFRSGG